MPKFDFSGDVFVGLDSDIFGDGGADTQARDVYIAQRLRANQRYLNRGRSSAVRSFTATDAVFDDADYPGERPFAGKDPFYPYVWPVYLRQGLSAAIVHLYYFAGSQGLETADGVRYKLTLLDQLDQVLAEQSGTLSLSTAYEHTTITASLPRPFSRSPGIGLVILELQSLDDGASGITIEVSAVSELSTALTSNGQWGNIDPGPASDSPEVQYLLEDTGSATVDIFAIDDNGTKEEIIFFGPNSYVQRPGSTALFDGRYLTYLQVRSAGLELQYDSDAIHPIGRGSLQAKQVERGPQAIEQASSPTALLKRPHLLSVGPGDFTDGKQQSSWPTDYRMRHPIAVGNGTSEFELIDDSFFVTTEDPDIELIALVIATVDISGGVNPAALETGSSDWIFDLEAEQFDLSDSDWSTPTAIGGGVQTDTVKTFTTDWPRSRFFRSKTILHDYSNVNGSLFSGGTAITAFRNWQFAFREGQLYPEDIALISAVRFRFPLTISDPSVPVRLNVTAKYDDDTLEGLPALGGITSGSVLAESFHLTLVGFTLWEWANV